MIDAGKTALDEEFRDGSDGEKLLNAKGLRLTCERFDQRCRSTVHLKIEPDRQRPDVGGRARPVTPLESLYQAEIT